MSGCERRLAQVSTGRPFAGRMALGISAMSCTKLVQTRGAWLNHLVRCGIIAPLSALSLGVTKRETRASISAMLPWQARISSSRTLFFAMKDILRAFIRSLASLSQRGVLWHLVWPTLVAVLLWTFVGVIGWVPLVQSVLNTIDGWSWTHDWLDGAGFGAAVAVVVIKIVLALMFVPLIYVTAALLVAAVALPMMLERVSRRDYSDLELRHGGSNMGSIWNAVSAGVVFLVGFLVSLPFWLIPGVGLVASVLLTAWLNQKAFGYDALMLHADRDEMQRLRDGRRPQMFGVGIGCALLAYVPLVNLVAPAFCGLAFVHFLLECLRQDRQGRGWTVVEAR